VTRAALPSPVHPRTARVYRHVPAAPAGDPSRMRSGDPSRMRSGDPSLLRSAEPGPPRDPGPLRSGDLVLDEARWTVHRAGTPVELSPTEFRLLACLMRHQGTVVSRAQLLRSVWGRSNTDQSQVIETYVSYLRRKLGRLGPPLIHTRRGVGYVLRSPGAGAG
jgi:DNA-binding response OmpR family regulator